MLRRSNSVSHIPLPKSEIRKRSKSSTNNPNAKRTTRTGSTERTAIPTLQRQNSSTSIKKSSLFTPTLQQTRGPSTIRSSSSIITPSTSRPRGRSPFRYGSGKVERNTNDKKWVNEQFLKVRTFLQNHGNCPENIVENLKPPTINTFVYVVNLLFKEIDPRVDINLTNYKEEVLRRLKGMCYSGNVSSSLLKTVNTMHAWPQVISIFAWLVDINLIITQGEPEIDDIKQRKIECISNYVTSRYYLYNENGDEQSADLECIAEMENILNVKCDDMVHNIGKIEQEIKELSIKKEKQLEQIRKIENQNTVTKKKIDILNLEVDTYYLETEQKQTELDHVIDHLKQRKMRITDEIESKRGNIAELQEKLKNQPCTYEEKCKLLAHIEELKQTLELKKESLDVQKEAKNVRETKLIEARKKMEKDVYHLNMKLMKLAVIKPELQALKLSETGFFTKEFGNEIKEVIKKMKSFEVEINQQIENLKQFIAKTKNENDCLVKQIESVKSEINNLNENAKIIDDNIEKINNLIACKLQESRDQHELFTEKIKKIQENEPNLDLLQQEYNQLIQIKREKEEHAQNMMKNSVIFFENVHDLFMDYLGKNIEIRNEIFDFLANCLKNIDKEQESMIEELKKLDSLRE